MSILNSQLNFTNQFAVQQTGGIEVSGVQVANKELDAVSGLNFGYPISGLNVNFVIPSGTPQNSLRYLEVAKYANASGTVTVSGAAGVTINGVSLPVTIAGLTGKTFYAPSGVNTYYSF